MNPRLVIDRDNDIWTLVQSGNYYSDAYNTSKSLQELNAEYGPLRELVPSAELDIYTFFLAGQTVKVKTAVTGNLIVGTVKSYNREDKTYDVIVTIPRSFVSE